MSDDPNFDPAIETRARAYLQQYLAGDLGPFSDAQLEYRFGIHPNGNVNQFGIMWVPGDATGTQARLKEHFGWPSPEQID
jgi:hypothetical protein